MVAIGVISACLASASRGNSIGMGLAVAMIVTVIPLMTCAIVYWVTLRLAHLTAFLSPASQPPNDSQTPAEIREERADA